MSPNFKFVLALVTAVILSLLVAVRPAHAETDELCTFVAEVTGTTVQLMRRGVNPIPAAEEALLSLDPDLHDEFKQAVRWGIIAAQLGMTPQAAAQGAFASCKKGTV